MILGRYQEIELMTQREEIKAKIANYKDEFQDLSDDDLIAERLKWKELTIQYQAADEILKKREKDRDPTGKILKDLAVRVESIEQSATQHEFKTWAFWISIIAVIVSIFSLIFAYSQIKKKINDQNIQPSNLEIQPKTKN